MFYLVLDGSIFGSGFLRDKTPDLVDIDDWAEVGISLVMESSHTELSVIAYYYHIKEKDEDQKNKNEKNSISLNE